MKVPVLAVMIGHCKAFLAQCASNLPAEVHVLTTLTPVADVSAPTAQTWSVNAP